MLLPTHFVLARDLLDFWLFRGHEPLWEAGCVVYWAELRFPSAASAAQPQPRVSARHTALSHLQRCNRRRARPEASATWSRQFSSSFALQLVRSAAWTCCSPPASRVRRVPAAQSHSISVALKLKPATTSRAGASGLGVHFGGGDLQLSAHADADAEVCLQGAQQPEPSHIRAKSKQNTRPNALQNQQRRELNRVQSRFLSSLLGEPNWC